MVFTQLLSATHMLSLTVLLSFLIYTTFTPTYTQAVPLFPSGPRRYCSNTLTEAIAEICQGRFNSLSLQYPGSVGGAYYRPRAIRRLLTDDGTIFRPKPSGPIHECCKKPCSIVQLQAYCSPD